MFSSIDVNREIFGKMVSMTYWSHKLFNSYVTHPLMSYWTKNHLKLVVLSFCHCERPPLVCYEIHPRQSCVQQKFSPLIQHDIVSV